MGQKRHCFDPRDHDLRPTTFKIIRVLDWWYNMINVNFHCNSSQRIWWSTTSQRTHLGSRNLFKKCWVIHIIRENQLQMIKRIASVSEWFRFNGCIFSTTSRCPNAAMRMRMRMMKMRMMITVPRHAWHPLPPPAVLIKSAGKRQQ